MFIDIIILFCDTMRISKSVYQKPATKLNGFVSSRDYIRTRNKFRQEHQAISIRYKSFQDIRI
jgi:hypothetical protein